MFHTRSLLAFAVFLFLASMQALPSFGKPAAKTVLQGTVSSQEEGAMEGVLVSAKKSGSTITVTVLTNDKGYYEFPANRLSAGDYSLAIRAVGYKLATPVKAHLEHGKSATEDLKLQKATQDEEASQLTNWEWLASFPGTTEQRASAQPCTHCHTLERPARSTFSADQFFPVINRMLAYPASSFPLMPQARPVDRRGGGPLTPEQKEAQMAARHKLAEYLASINLSSGPEWKYPFKTEPRPAGDETKVIITEYALPKATRQAHDVVVDPHGMIWYASFGEQILGKLDPKTGKVTEYDAPMPKPNAGTGTLAIRCDKEGNLWMGMISQGALARFDPKTEKFQTYMLPPDQDADYREFDNIATEHHDVDGKVWLIESGTFTVLRLDLASGNFESFEPFPIPRPNIYDIASDSQNNAYFTVFGDERIGRIDAKTGRITFYKTPTAKSGPRRIKIDENNRAWFSENRGDKIGMFDTTTNEFKEWPAKTPGTYPYSAIGDKYGDAWAGNEYTDRVLRVNTRTGTAVEYLLPRHTNMRSATVDNSTNPATFWVGNNHGGSIVKVEPLSALQ